MNEELELKLKAQLCKKLLNVATRVGYVQKDKNSAMRYSFVSHDRVTGSVRGPMAEEGIYYSADVIEGEREVLSNDGKLLILFSAKVAVCFVDTDTGYSITRTSMGMGLDPSDKAYGKAISYAVKYALLKSLMLETGDDPESDEHSIGRDGGSLGGQKYGGPVTEAPKAKPAPPKAVEGSDAFINGGQQRKIFAHGLNLGLKREEIEQQIVAAGFRDGDRPKTSIIPVTRMDEVLGLLDIAAEKK